MTVPLLTEDRIHATSRPRLLSLSAAAPLAAGVLTLVAFALRVWTLGRASLWLDEGLSLYYVNRPLTDLFPTLAREDFHPPLYYLLLQGWIHIAGTSEFALRFLSLMLGVLLVPIGYATLREIYRPRGRPSLDLALAVPGSALIMLSPILIYYSQEVRMYSLVACLALLSVLTLLRAARLDGHGWRPWLVFALVTTALFYTHYQGFFLLPALALFALFAGRRVFLHWLGAMALAALLYAPWGLAVAAQVNTKLVNPDYFADSIPPATVISQLVDGFLALDSSLLLMGALLVLTLVGTVAIAWDARRDGGLARRQALLLLAAIVPLVVTGVAVLIMPKFATRYALLAAPALDLVLVLLLFAAVWRGWVGWRALYTVLVCAVLLFTGKQMWRAVQSTEPPHEDARGIAEYMTGRAKSDEAIVMVENARAAFEYYYRGAAPVSGVHVGLDFADGAQQLNQVLRSQPTRVWLVLWHNEFADPTAMVISELQRRSKGPPTVRSNYREYTLMRFDMADWSPVEALPRPQQALDANFGDRLKLVGADTLTPQPNMLRWILYWQALQPLTSDYSVALRLRDADGKVVLTHNQAPSTPYLASGAMPVGETVRGYTEVRLPSSVPPGKYDVEILVWDIQEQRNLDTVGQGGSAGIVVPLAPIEVPRSGK